jgi:probable rRNA maturation factor
MRPKPAQQGASVRLTVEGGPWTGVSRADVVRRVRAMLALLQLSDVEVSIVLTGDDQIQNLNRLYRKKDRPTDVLAFAQREGEHGDPAGGLLGDVIVSVPTARRQALAASRDLTAELTMLLAHGVLHLLGWDHETAKKDREMRAETDRLCEAAERSAPRTGGPATRVRSKRRPVAP